MKNSIKYIFAVIALITGMLMHSCDDANNWKVEGEIDRLFRTLLFEDSRLLPTAVEIKYNFVIDAAEYVFEFSKDNFESIQQEVVILADTLTVFAASNDALRIEYRTVFEGLDGTSDYWVRMHAVNAARTLKSGYVSFEFTTPDEQIFKNYVPLSDELTLVWEPNDVTHINFYSGKKERNTETEEGITIEDLELLESRTLSATDKTDGKATFTGLSMGNYYTAQIFNDDVLRGTLVVKTLGISGSEVLKVNTTDNAESITEKIAALVNRGIKNLTVEFTPGATYEIGGKITIPAGTGDITFIGSENNAGVMTTLSNCYLESTTTVNNVTFEYLEMTGSGSMFFTANGTTFNDILFEGCYVSNINSIVYLNNNATGNSINVNNCWISKTGGWGMLNVGANNTIGSINVTNCTLTEINTRFADVRVKTHITFKNITACNINETMSHLWLFDNGELATVTIENTIISGPNNGIALHSTNGNYNTMVTYASCYKTSDLVEDSRELTDITEVPLDIYGLFVDPENGDFHIRKNAGFAGTGVAGDPRWFE